jgi:molybdopterin adenylyltransferase
MINCAILSISTTRNEINDESGKILKKTLKDEGFEVPEYKIIKDDINQIKENLILYSDKQEIDIILTTGGTGFGPLDITPEATLEVIEKNIPGISEMIRIEGLKKTVKACLSRGVSGIRKNTLIINLPGSPKGAKESLNIILPILSHSIGMINGQGH